MKDYKNMTDCAREEWIDRYLMGELPSEENYAFETLMQTNLELRKEVELHAEIMAVFQESTPESLKPIVSVSPIRTIFRQSRPVLRIAAMVLLVSTIGLYIGLNEVVLSDKAPVTTFESCNGCNHMPYA